MLQLPPAHALCPLQGGAVLGGWQGRRLHSKLSPRLITMSEGTDSQTSLSIEEEGSRTLADLPDSLLHEIFGHLDPGNT